MSYIAQERHLIRSLSPFQILSHFFMKYSKAKPTTAMLVELWSKTPIEAAPGTIQLSPFDPVFKQIRIVTSPTDANTPEELVLVFPQQAVHLTEVQQRYGDYTLEFDAETMTSSFVFGNIRSFYVDKISCRYTGKFTENEDGNFSYIDPVHYERRRVERERMNFKSFALHFRSMGWK